MTKSWIGLGDLRINFWGESTDLEYYISYLTNFFLERNFNPKKSGGFSRSVDIIFDKNANITKIKENIPFQRNGKFILNQTIIEYYDKDLSIYSPSSHTQNTTYPVLLFKSGEITFLKFKHDILSCRVLLGAIKEIYMSHMVDNNWSIFHSNTVSSSESKALVLVGHSGSGKTTMSFGLAQYNNVEITSDDRALINYNKSVGVFSDIINFKKDFKPINVKPLKIDFTKKDIVLWIVPNFLVDHKKEPLIKNLNENEIEKVMISNCLSLRDTWRDEFKVIPIKAHNREKSSIENVNYHRKSGNFIHITFGPNTNYKDLYTNLLKGL
jgi:hypothetical protein